MQKIDVLIDRETTEISLVTVGDDGTEHETSLSLETAWELVCELSKSIQKLKPPVPEKKPIRIKSNINKSLVPAGALRHPEQLREAVLESVGSMRYANTGR